MEEIQIKPGIKDIRERKLVQKSDNIQAETKDSYIWMHDFAPQKDFWNAMRLFNLSVFYI